MATKFQNSPENNLTILEHLSRGYGFTVSLSC